MAKASRQAASGGRSEGKTAQTKRYRSVAEIKRDLFPNAAAAELADNAHARGYETLMEDFFGPRQRSPG